YRVLPPPALEEGAEPMPSPEEEPIRTGGGEPVASRPPSAAETPAPGPQPPAETAPPRAVPWTAEPPPARAVAATADAEPAAPAAPAAAAPSPPARPAEAEHVEPDQETLDRVLAEELAKGTDRRVAEG